MSRSPFGSQRARPAGCHWEGLLDHCVIQPPPPPPVHSTCPLHLPSLTLATLYRWTRVLLGPPHLDGPHWALSGHCCRHVARWPSTASSCSFFITSSQEQLPTVCPSHPGLPELAFAAVVLMSLARAVAAPAVQRFADVGFVANIVAQCCCWYVLVSQLWTAGVLSLQQCCPVPRCRYSVLTRNQLGHIVEETIWGFSGLGVAWVCALATSQGAGTWTRAGLVSSSPSAQALLRRGKWVASLVRWM